MYCFSEVSTTHVTNFVFHSGVMLTSQAKSILGEMRVRCNAIKQELESNIQLYKDSVKQSRTVEKQIQVIALTT